MAQALSNTITVERLADEIDDLIDARITWENGSYKASNDELYRLRPSQISRFTRLFAVRSGWLSTGKRQHFVSRQSVVPHDHSAIGETPHPPLTSP